MASFRISAFADEASDTLPGQIAALKRNGIGYIEPRNVNGNLIKKTDAELYEIAGMLAEASIGVSSLGSPIGKFNIDEDFDLHLELHRLDCICSNGIMENYLLLLDLKRETALNPPPPPPLISGKDLLTMGLVPGPVFTEILQKTFEMQCTGKLKNRREALEYAGRISRTYK